MFSKYDVYTIVQSLYCYPDSDVLKNKLNIIERDELKQAEEGRLPNSNSICLWNRLSKG